jgi:hypothetical protein
LERRFQEETITGLGHPARSGKMAIVNGPGALRLLNGVEAEDDRDDLAPIGTLFVRVEQAKIRRQMALVIARNPDAVRWTVLECRRGNLRPPGRMDCGLKRHLPKFLFKFHGFR